MAVKQKIKPPRTEDIKEIKRWRLQISNLINMLPPWDRRLDFDVSTGVFTVGKLVTGGTS